MLRLTLFLLSLSAGAVAAWLTVSVQGSEAPAAPVALEPAPAPALRHVLVAAADIEGGATLTTSDLEWQEWPEQAVNPVFVTREDQPAAIDEMDGSVIRRAIARGEPVREDRLALAGTGLLSAILPSGKRAVAIRITAESTAGGFILPNDRVDVLHTRSNESSSSSTRTLLRNVRVLAIDQRAEEESDSLIGKTATLELDPDQTEQITAAETSGLLSLALRSTADNAESQTVAAPPERSNRTIRIFRAGQGETVQVE